MKLVMDFVADRSPINYWYIETVLENFVYLFVFHFFKGHITNNKLELHIALYP